MGNPPPAPLTSGPRRWVAGSSFPRTGVLTPGRGHWAAPAPLGRCCPPRWHLHSAAGDGGVCGGLRATDQAVPGVLAECSPPVSSFQMEERTEAPDFVLRAEQP